MARVFISPSDQHANMYAGRSGISERDVCRRVAASAARYLASRAGVIVRVGADVDPRFDEYAARVQASNAFGADLHVAIHTNAGEGGGLGLFYSGSAASKAFTGAILKRVGPVSTSSDPGLRVGDNLYELNATSAVAAYIELDRHDTAAGATEILGKIDAYGWAIAAGICDYLYIPAPARVGVSGQPKGSDNMAAPLDKMATTWNGGVRRQGDPRARPDGTVATIQEIADAKTFAARAVELVEALDARLDKMAAALDKLAPASSADKATTKGAGK